ncbi:hypothetical protein Sjap_026092 [Stephania japonica]|uniref:Uncharacterized protein n=1 Tax=Stephania japonica TaxID=461633 RepID=A0AAP0HIK2_9MAGN
MDLSFLLWSLCLKGHKQSRILERTFGMRNKIAYGRYEVSLLIYTFFVSIGRF